MNGEDFNSNPPLNPRKALWAMRIKFIDRLSWVFPACAAFAFLFSGIATFKGINDLADVLGIIGWITSAAGVWFTGWASRIRDDRLAVAHAVGSLALDLADSHDRLSTILGGTT